jgi:hypothetical protein
MELHPDDRPGSVEDLRQLLNGTRDIPISPQGKDSYRNSIPRILKGRPEQVLLWISGSLLVISLIASLIP